MTLSVSTFLTFAMYITMINKEMPKSSTELSAFGIFLFGQMTISGLVIVLTACELHFYIKGGEEIPAFLQKLMFRRRRERVINDPGGNKSLLRKILKFTLWIRRGHKKAHGVTENPDAEMEVKSKDKEEDAKITFKMLEKTLDKLFCRFVVVLNIVSIAVFVWSVCS